MHLPLGKLNPEILQKRVLGHVVTDESVLNPPAIGEDGAVFRTKQNVVVAASDPITGVKDEEKLGNLSVHINTNDILVHAATPRWYFVTVLLSKEGNEETIENVMRGIRKGAKEVGANVMGGHTELTKKVNDPIVSGFMLGRPMVDSKFVTSGGGKPGDRIIMTKGAGIEGTSIIASDCKDKLTLDPKVLQKGRELEKSLSIMPEVQTLVEKVGIEQLHAMHDATEGGILGAVYEMSIASKKGFTIQAGEILIREETRKICEAMNVDPLKLISSGSLILAVPEQSAEKALKVLNEHNIDATSIGRLTKKKERLLERGGTIENIHTAPTDEIWSLV